MAELIGPTVDPSGIAFPDRKMDPGLETYGTFEDSPKDEVNMPKSVQQAMAERQAIAEGRLVNEEDISTDPEVFQYLGFSDEGEKGDWAMVIQAGNEHPAGGSLDLLAPSLIVSFPLQKGCLFKTPTVEARKKELLAFYRKHGVRETDAQARAQADAEPQVRRIKVALMHSMPYLTGRLISVGRHAQQKRAEAIMDIRAQLLKATGQDVFAMAEKLGINLELTPPQTRATETQQPKLRAVPRPVAAVPQPPEPRTITLPQGAH